LPPFHYRNAFVGRIKEEQLMSEFSNVTRRRFLKTSAALAAASALAGEVQANADDRVSLKGRIFKTLKIGMIRVKGTLTEKFAAAKTAGFAGVEMNAPGMNADETKKAIAETGLPVDGTVCGSHWQVRHTDPSAEVRAKALDNLQTAIRDTHAVGGHTVLLVIGHGKDGTEQEIWKRCQENMAKAIPLAAERGIVIAIENVWNHFLYDHNGGSDQTADKFVKFVDELNSPWVGMQFDIGNHWKFGNTGDWIRALGKRIVKLDAKGFSRANDKFTKIGEGDLDWKDSSKALLEINFTGWCAAEVSGGGPDRLKEVSDNMDKVFHLNPSKA
jgi:hexulose-6-phosphate isomerase